MKRILTLILIMTAVSVIRADEIKTQSRSRHARLPEKELHELSNAIKASGTYLRTRQTKIDSIVQQLNESQSAVRRWECSYALSEQYRALNTDSALHYASMCMDLAQFLGKTEEIQSQITMVGALSTAGIFTQAQTLFTRLGGDEMSIALKCLYWQSGRMLYSYMRAYVADQSHFYNIYNQQYMQYDDSLLRHLPRENRFRDFIECERMVSDGHYRMARMRLESLLESLRPTDNLYGMAAFQLAEVYRQQGDETMYASFLARSATSDVKNCVREGVALPTLAHWLYEQGDLDDAFAYINFALEDAMSGNVRMRTVSIARIVPMIDEAYRRKINASRDEMMVYFLLVTALLIVSGCLLFVLLRQIRRSRINARKLAVTTQRQEAYIGNFISLYSSYADRLDRFMKLVSLKLSSGKVDELQKIIDSGKFGEEDSNDLYATFDAAFLDIYPEFVAGINALLRDDEQIKLKADNVLTPELRIYAFVRLGVDESARIAQILHYSNNTVYAYRNRMRNRAKNRETFDSEVMNIGRDE